MIRKNPVSVKVKAPSKGLVTRWPAETADRFELGNTDLGTVMQGMVLHRTAAAALNMRFEDGVMTNAPGYESVLVIPPLLFGALSHWKLEEPSGSIGGSTVYADAVGSSPLVGVPVDLPGWSPAQGQPEPATQVTGKLSFGQMFAMNNASYPTLLGPVNSSPFSFGDVSFTICGWVKFVSGADASTQGIVDKWSLPLFAYAGAPDETALPTEYRIYRSTGDIIFQVHTTAGGGHTGTVTAVGAIADAAWHFFCARHDAAGNTLKITIDSTTTTQAYTFGVEAGTRRFTLGAAGAAPNLELDSVTVYNRAISAAEVTALYNAGSGIELPFWTGGTAFNLLYEGNLILTAANTSSRRPFICATQDRIYSATLGRSGFTPTLTLAQLFSSAETLTTGYLWDAADFLDKVIFAQKDNVPQYSVGGTGTCAPVPGLAVSSTDPYTATSDGYEKFEGVATFFNHLFFWRQDLLLWSDVNDFGNYIPVGQTVISTTLPIMTFTGGSNAGKQPDPGGTIDLVFTNTSGTNPVLVPGMFVRFIYTTGGIDYYNYYTVSSAADATHATVKLLGTTGRSPKDTVFSTPQTLFSIDANESGSTRLVGAFVNGPIYQCTQMGDYLYVFKEWSIQSIQYVGIGSGVFYSRNEVLNEGMIGRNAMVNLGNGTIVFLGHRELYSYQGGSKPAAVCRQFTRQLLKELDRSRMSEIVLCHKQLRNEVWVVYPTTPAGQKVLVWNYVEDTASIDEYDTTLGALQAFSRSTWVTSLPWTSGLDTETWAGASALDSWASIPDAGTQDLTLVAMGGGSCFIHGEVYNRDGGGYLAYAETQDFDLEDSAAFKYVDVVRVGLQIVGGPEATVRRLYVQVGARSTLDETITWTDPKQIEVQGDANFTAKVNPGGAGRYIRVKFYSTDPDVKWRVSSFEVYARKGGTY